MGPPLILLIKSKNDDKLDKYFVNIKLCRDPTPEKLYLYELKMTFLIMASSRISCCSDRTFN